jgi:GT2 family glycosyltransferase
VAPRISVLLPVYNTPQSWLRRAIDSVRGQSYPGWELCIADDASTDPEVRRLVSAYAAADERIRVVYRDENGHIAAASNSALELATGEFVALLDHDDELAPDALAWFVAEVQRHPDAAILYSDEDRLDEWGRPFDPHFKPDWNPDLFFSQNYLCHLTMLRTALVRQVGGFRLETAGAQDYDLFLRCIRRCGAEQIRHIPRVLYHWRAGAGSTSRDLAAKNFASPAGLKALRDYFVTIDPRISVQPGSGATTYRVVYPLPERPPRVSLVIPTRDGATVLRRCLDSLRALTEYSDYEVIIVNNGSIEPATFALFAELREDPRIRVIDFPGAFNYAAINNLASELATGEVLGLLNNDLEIIAPQWLTAMVRHAMRPDVGAVGAKLYYPNGRIQHGGVVLGLLGIANHAHQFLPRGHGGYFGRLQVVQNVAAVTGACLVVRRELYREVGGLDATNLPVAYNDIDFCLRLRAAGYRTVWTPEAELLHYESVSRGRDSTGANRTRLDRESAFMRQRWGALLEHDPYYNPNLSLRHRDYRPVWPTRVEGQRQ